MNRYLVITIDVEPDCSADWRYSSPLTFNGVHEGIGSRLQPLFNKYDIIPTYLINNVVLEDDASIETFRNLEGKFEMGTHLHPEFIEPTKSEFDYAGKKGVANCCFYDPEIEFGKIKSITDLFARRFNFQPTSFRAGRFSAGSNTLKSLEKLGYKVDTSVTPNFRWDDRTREKPVDFTKAPLQPYWVNQNNIVTRDSKGRLLEVPVSIILKKMGITESIKYIIKNKRWPYKASNAVWLRPKFSGKDQFKSIVENISSSHHSNESIVFNMMFHNVEVMPGLSPYSLNENDCATYLESLEWFFRYCNQNNIKSSGLSSLYDVFRKK
jgi:hypothetical protein